MPRKPFYITTPIYYPSSNLHIGHAYTTVAADAVARYKRLTGHDVFFLTGTDEHGQKIQRKAEEAGKPPKQFVDEIVAGITDLWRKLHISYDDFIRTTEERHRRVVQAIFERLYARGDIYKSRYQGWYCTPCETFWPERQVTEGKCPNPDCGRPVELVEEESYFFRLSRYADRLLRHIEDNPDFIQPPSRRNEMISFIKSGLEDLCVSRTTFDWGIRVPFDAGHVVYVWVDALTNYISAAGYLADPPRFERYWPADVHLVGKEIVRFHTVIWPIILMALDLPLPRKVFGHGWLILESGKMSKSRGNVIDPVVLMERYGVDAVRYFLLREIPFGADGYYAEPLLVQRINSDLANDLGNLLYRTLSMMEKFVGGVTPEPGPEEETDRELRELAAVVVGEVEERMDRLELSGALEAIWKLVKRCNKYIDETAPWALAREGRTGRLNRVMYNLVESLRVVAIMLTPFMVETPERIWRQLGLAGQVRRQPWERVREWGLAAPGRKVRRGEPLFPRIEDWGEEALPAEAAPAAEGGQESPAVATAGGGHERAETPVLTISEFQRLDLRVAVVREAERIPGTSRLLRLVLNVGENERQVVAGLAPDYEPAALVGKRVILVANLKPARVRGVESQGMILAAEDGDGVAILTTDRPVVPGVRVT